MLCYTINVINTLAGNERVGVEAEPFNATTVTSGGTEGTDEDTTITDVTETPTEPSTTTEETTTSTTEETTTSTTEETTTSTTEETTTSTTEGTTTDGAGLAYASAITLTALCVAAMVL